MNNEEKILSVLESMNGRLDKIEGRIGDLEASVKEIKETLDEHTVALDALIEWTDNVQEIVRVPFAKVRNAK